MEEVYKFRLCNEYLPQICGSENDGHWMNKTATSVSGTVGDDQYLRIQKLEDDLRKINKHALQGGYIERTFSKEETDKGKLFLINFRYKHAAGEEHGTWYTDEVLNADCGVERKQLRILQHSPFRSVIEETKDLKCSLSSQRLGPLQIPFSKLMKSQDIFSLWGGETVISERLVELIKAGGFSGGKLLEISNTGKGTKSLRDLSDVPTGAGLLFRAAQKGLKPSDCEYWKWLEEPEQLSQFDKALWEQKALYESINHKDSSRHKFMELTVQSPPLRISDKTRFGDDPFREATEHCKCQFGEIRGRLQSQLVVHASSWDGSDICQTDVFFGGRRGLFRPLRLLIVSKRLFEAMRLAKIKKIFFEVVELVP